MYAPCLDAIPLLVLLLIATTPSVKSLPVHGDFIIVPNELHNGESLDNPAYTSLSRSDPGWQELRNRDDFAGQLISRDKFPLTSDVIANDISQEIADPTDDNRRNKRTLSINSDIALLRSGFRRALKSNWAEYWIKQLKEQRVKKRSVGGNEYDKEKRALKMNALRQQLRMLMQEK